MTELQSTIELKTCYWGLLWVEMISLLAELMSLRPVATAETFNLFPSFLLFFYLW